MDSSFDREWLLSSMRGEQPGDSLAADVQQLTTDMNQARKDAVSEGQDDAGVMAAIRHAWEAHPWEVRYASVAAAFAQWFALTSGHNLDRIGPLPRVAASNYMANIAMSNILTAFPELERAFMHEDNACISAEDFEGGKRCSCFAQLVYQLKPEAYLKVGGEDESESSAGILGFGQKGEA